MSTTSSNPTNFRPGFLRRFFRWLFSWRSVRWALIGIVGLITLAALFWTEEYWRGKHDWEKYKRQWEAKGEQFDFAAFVPPPVAADQNFFMAPIWKAAMSQRWQKNESSGIVMAPEANAVDKLKINLFVGDEMGIRANERFGNWRKGTLTDLRPWQTYFRKVGAKTNLFPIPSQPQTPAADVVLALSRYDPIIQALRKACERPKACLPKDCYLNFSANGPVLMRVLADLKSCIPMLQLRAVAELDAGQTAKALDDVRLMFCLDDSIRHQPLLISELVRIVIVQFYSLQPIYEGLAKHRWSDTQLVQLESILAREDFLADYESCMRGERDFGISMMAYRPQYHRLNPFVYQWKLADAQAFQRWILPAVNLKAHLVSPKHVHHLQEEAANEWKHATAYNIIAKMSLPALLKAPPHFAYAQSAIDLARVACALERYRIAQGQYPEKLEALSPHYIDKLPHDVINGQPLHYRRTNDGHFVLYSVGWNDRDDGGTVALRKHSAVEWREGDWVWRYPAR